MSEYNEIFHMEIEDESEYSAGAPKTPRGADGLLDGDRLPDMPEPETQLFVIVAMGDNRPKDIVLRPVETIPYVPVSNYKHAKEVARAQTETFRSEGKIPFAVYGPYESEEEIAEKPWLHPRSTPCDVYEFLPVVVRTLYSNVPGKEPLRVTEDKLNHTHMGFVAPSKNVIENQPALQIPGSRLTSYLTPEGDIIHPNVTLLSRLPSEKNLEDPEFAQVYKKVTANQSSPVDAFIDNEFRRALPTLMKYNDMSNTKVPFIFVGKQGKLFEGIQDVPLGKLPLEFAKILRTGINSFYGDVICITLILQGEVVEFPVGQQHDN